MRKLILVAVFLFAFAVPLLAQDPVKVDSKHYKIEVENSQVRVLRVKYGPREKSVMHSHPFGVVIYLTDAHVRFHLPGGKSEVKTGKAGTAEMTPEGEHLPENLDNKPFEAILVELKGKEAEYAELKDDPLTIDPKHYVSESDVSQNAAEDTFVRTLHVKYGPREKSLMHSHPDAVVVFLTDAHFKFTLGNGQTRTADSKAGAVMFAPAETHLPENLADQKAEIIMVELKTKPGGQ